MFVLLTLIIPWAHSQVYQIESCPPLPPRSQPPSSVKDLRIDDFEMIVGIGDSLMAGLNSRFKYSKEMSKAAILNLANTHGKYPENRGVNYITGGDDDSTSVGQLMSYYNPSLYGLSKGNTSLLFCYGPICPTGSRFLPYEPESMGLNAAQSGAWTIVSNTLNQIDYLDRYMDSFIPKSLKNPWKLFFVELGFNNICLGCTAVAQKAGFSASHFEFQIRELLKELRSRYTNAFIVMMGPFQMSQLLSIKEKYSICNVNNESKVGCMCLMRQQMFKNGRINMDKLAREYNQVLEKVSAEYQAINHVDFAVVFDPGFGQLNITNGTLDLVSDADCFHPSVQSHNRAGIGIWNNLFKSKEEKLPLDIRNPQKIYCPDESTRLWAGN